MVTSSVYSHGCKLCPTLCDKSNIAGDWPYNLGIQAVLGKQIMSQINQATQVYWALQKHFVDAVLHQKQLHISK